MPPPLPPDSPEAQEEAESSGEEQVPPQKQGRPPKAKPEPTKQGESGEEDSEGDEDEYVVEKIIGHRFMKGVLEFDVKWQGYENPEDRTWEPESNMDGAVDVMKEYFEDIGGRPEPKSQKRKGRQSIVKSESETPASTTKRAKQEKAWSPPPGSWEHEISHIDTVEENLNPITGDRQRFAYLVWNNQKKTQHPLRHVYQKCPQKMLLYYESHLVFTPNKDSEDSNGDDEGNNIMMQDAY